MATKITKRLDDLARAIKPPGPNPKIYVVTEKVEGSLFLTERGGDREITQQEYQALELEADRTGGLVILVRYERREIDHGR